VILTILAIWLLVGLLTALIISITSDEEVESIAGLLGLVVILGPIGGLAIAQDAFRRYRNRRRESKRPYTEDYHYDNY
jgi:hypothetical protein